MKSWDVDKLAIMTSDDTHEKTLALLTNSKYFGLDKQAVTLLKQEKVPALSDGDATLCVGDDGAPLTK